MLSYCWGSSGLDTTCSFSVDRFASNTSTKQQRRPGHINTGIIFSIIWNSQSCLDTTEWIVIGCSLLWQVCRELIGWYWEWIGRQFYALTRPFYFELPSQSQSLKLMCRVVSRAANLMTLMLDTHVLRILGSRTEKASLDPFFTVSFRHIRANICTHLNGSQGDSSNKTNIFSQTENWRGIDYHSAITPSDLEWDHKG